MTDINMVFKIHPSLLGNAKPKGQMKSNGTDQFVPLLSERRKSMRDEHSNVLVGATSICRYMKISAIKTLQRWVDGYGFPAIKTPDGKWLTTTSAIDEWIWLAAEVEAKNKLNAKTKQVIATISGQGHEHNGPTYTASNMEREARQGVSNGQYLVQTAGKRIMKGYDVV